MADYVHGVKQLGEYADYLVVNVSSPNTPNLRALQRKEELQQLMTAVLNERDALALRIGRRVPVLVKLSPDLSDEELVEAAAVAKQCKVEGIIISNTTVQRPATLRDRQASETVQHRRSFAGFF
jgi:dihydroorotate dehydrogenase